jgi:hypothetical protein
MKQRRKALWGLICVSMLSAALIGGLRIYGRTASSKGNVSSATSAASQVIGVVPWTAVASTGTVDESAFVGGAPIFAFGPPLFPAALYPPTVTGVGYNPASASLAPIILRYNVTNTFETGPLGPTQPTWQFLELGSTAPQGSAVTATLFRVSPCTGQQAVICSVTNSNQLLPAPPAAPGICLRCQFPAGTINFAGALYHVEVVLRRTSTTAPSPAAHTLRIF